MILNRVRILTGVCISIFLATSVMACGKDEQKTVSHDEHDNMTIVGLPTENFNLANLPQNNDEAWNDRITWSTLSDFFAYDGLSARMIAFVRVSKIERWDDEYSYSILNRVLQYSTLHVISVVWSQEKHPPQTVKLGQEAVGVSVTDENTNLLREGGVYLLPLIYHDYGDFMDGMWTLNSDVDVLFEIDDKGRVWSHSKYEDFNRFDGEEARVLADAISSVARLKHP